MDKVQTSLFQRGERRVTVELQGLSTEHSRYPNRPPDFSSMLPLPKLRIRVNSPHLPCGAEDSISSLTLAPGREGARNALLGSEDDVEVVLAELAPDCQNCLESHAEEVQIGAIERGKEGRGKAWPSPIRHGVLNGWGHLRMSFGNEGGEEYAEVG